MIKISVRNYSEKKLHAGGQMLKEVISRAGNLCYNVRKILDSRRRMVYEKIW